MEGPDFPAEFFVVQGLLGEDELGGDDGRDGTEEGDADQHEARGDDAAFGGDGIGVAIPDGGHGGERPPERIAARLDGGPRRVPLGLDHERGAEDDHDHRHAREREEAFVQRGARGEFLQLVKDAQDADDPVDADDLQGAEGGIKGNGRQEVHPTPAPELGRPPRAPPADEHVDEEDRAGGVVDPAEDRHGRRRQHHEGLEQDQEQGADGHGEDDPIPAIEADLEFVVQLGHGGNCGELLAKGKGEPRAGLEYQHRVAVTEEAVVGADGLGIDFLQPGQPRRTPRSQEGGHQAKQGRPGEVEIREEHLRAADGVAGTQEEARLRPPVAGGGRGEGPAFPQAVLGGTDGGRTHRQTRAPIAQGGQGPGGDRIGLAVHHVLGEVRHLNGLKSAGPDVKREVEGLMTAGLQLREEFGREVQARRRSGHGARGGGIRIDGLITRRVIRRREAAIFAGFHDVRRER